MERGALAGGGDGGGEWSRVVCVWGGGREVDRWMRSHN